MFHRQSVVALLTLVLVAACGALATSPSPAVPGAPTASLPSPTGSPSATPSPTPPPTISPATPSPTIAPASPSPTPAPTMKVRAYFLLDDRAAGDPALVPVLRNVPIGTDSPATAAAAITALLLGPSASERAASPRIRTLIPAGTKLRGIKISDRLATVDLSGAFATGGGTLSVRGRLAQVVYTMTQFTTVDRVSFELDGKPVTTFSSEGIVLDKPVTRATYQDDLLPPIFVDLPAWGATQLTHGRVTGLANVFEAQFRIAILDRNDKVLTDALVHASCGTGCWGRFAVTLAYDVATAQWGTLRVWDISEATGKPVAVREYPVYLRPAP